MSTLTSRSVRLVLGLLPLVALSCTGYPDPAQGGLADGQRLISGLLLAANAMELGQRDAALQLAALTFPQGDCGNPVVYTGPAFDPAPRGATRSTVPMQMTVPCTDSVHLFLQRASQGAARGEVIAPIVFAAYGGGPTTTLIPGIDPAFTGGICRDPSGGQLIGRRINLGTVVLPATTPAPTVLGGGDDSLNPLSQVDSDADGTFDFDQGAPGDPDGGTTPPVSQCDSNQNGIPDILEQ
jgi:hypothetical protein